jgi:hypothetical protein
MFSLMFSKSKRLFFRDRDPRRFQLKGAGGPAEKDLGRNRLWIGSKHSKNKLNLVFIDYKNLP